MSNPTDLSTTNIINCKPAVIIIWSYDRNLRKGIPYFGFILHSPVYRESKKSPYPRFIFSGKSTEKEVNWFQLVHMNTFKPITVARKVDHRCLCNPVDCSLPGSSIYGIFQARILEWVVISFSRRSSQPRDWTRVSHIVRRCFTIWATREVKSIIVPLIYFPRYRLQLKSEEEMPKSNRLRHVFRGNWCEPDSSPFFLFYFVFYRLDLKFLHFNAISYLLPLIYHSYEENQNNIDGSKDHTRKKQRHKMEYPWLV